MTEKRECGDWLACGPSNRIHVHLHVPPPLRCFAGTPHGGPESAPVVALPEVSPHPRNETNLDTCHCTQFNGMHRRLFYQEIPNYKKYRFKIQSVLVLPWSGPVLCVSMYPCTYVCKSNTPATQLLVHAMKICEQFFLGGAPNCHVK